MSPQEIFDTVVRHLRAQGGPAMADDNRCVYRGPNNTKCAVGCLLPDEMYDPMMDDRRTTVGVTRLVRQFNVPSFFAQNLELLSKLQAAHDLWNSQYGHKSLRIRLLEAAKTFRLNTAVVDEHFPESAT